MKFLQIALTKPWLLSFCMTETKRNDCCLYTLYGSTITILRVSLHGYLTKVLQCSPLHTQMNNKSRHWYELTSTWPNLRCLSLPNFNIGLVKGFKVSIYVIASFRSDYIAKSSDLTSMLYFITLKEIWKNLKRYRKGAFSRLVCPSMVRATASILKKVFAFNSGNKTTDLKAEGTSMTNC